MTNQQLRRLLRRRPEMDEAEFELLQSRVLSRLTATYENGSEAPADDTSGSEKPRETPDGLNPPDVNPADEAADRDTAERPGESSPLTSIELPPTVVGVMATPLPASWDVFAADIAGPDGLAAAEDVTPAAGPALDGDTDRYEPVLGEDVLPAAAASADDMTDDDAPLRGGRGVLDLYRVPLDAGIAGVNDEVYGQTASDAVEPESVDSVPVKPAVRPSRRRPSKVVKAGTARTKGKASSGGASRKRAPATASTAAPNDEVSDLAEPVLSVPVEPEAVVGPVEPVEPVEPVPVMAEAVESVPAEPEPVVAEPVGLVPVMAVFVEPEPEVAEPVEPVPVMAEPAESGPVEPEARPSTHRPSSDGQAGTARLTGEPASRATIPKPAPAAHAVAGLAVAASCPYCAMLLQPPPEVSRRCPRCRERIIVKRVDGRVVYLTEASVLVFEAERRRMTNAGRWTKERARWLKVAADVDAPPERIARLGAALISEEVVTASRTLYVSTVERSFWAAKRDRRWEDASRIMREHALVLFRIAGSPIPAPEEIVRLHRAGAAAALRGLGGMARDAELVSAGCCDACQADDGQTFRIADELREPRLPHEGCPRGLCRCDWYLAVRDQTTVRRLLRRRARADARADTAVEAPTS